MSLMSALSMVSRFGLLEGLASLVVGKVVVFEDCVLDGEGDGDVWVVGLGGFGLRGGF